MNTKIILSALAAAALLTACTKQEGSHSTQTGKLDLDLSSGVQFKTRAVDETSYQTLDNYQVKITDAKGNEKFAGTYATILGRLPMELELGSYTIDAWYGSEEAASRNSFYVFGENTFSIKPDQTVTTKVSCVPTCGKVSVAFDASMSTYYSAYSVDFKGTKALGSGTFSWAAADTAPYYVKLEESGETLTYTINLKAKDAYATQLAGGVKQTEAVVNGTFTLARNKAYKLSIKPNYTPMTEGGLSIVITIDDSTNDHSVDIEVPVSWI